MGSDDKFWILFWAIMGPVALGLSLIMSSCSTKHLKIYESMNKTAAENGCTFIEGSSGHNSLLCPREAK